MSERDKYTEHCGVVATIGTGLSGQEFADGWWRIRNRGDDAWGLVTVTGEVVTADYVQKAPHQLLPISGLKNSNYSAELRLGHNRYATSGGSNADNAQPFLLSDEQYRLALAHNGNLPGNVVQTLRTFLDHALPADASDSRVMAHVLFEARQHYQTWVETFLAILPELQGAFSLICLTDENILYALRDPWGIHPLALGKKDEVLIVASESVAIDSMGGEFIREVKPGELVQLFPDGQMESLQFATMETGERLCALELIYFAKIDSLIAGEKIEKRRQALGQAVAKRFLTKQIPVDFVIPILNSGKQMSIGVSQVLAMANTEAITLTTEERSFIQNSQENRGQVVHAKHVVDGALIEGKRILLCDDSIVRGTSLSSLIKKIKEHCPAEIHIVLGSESVVDTCDLGVDLPTHQELLVYRLIQDRPDWENTQAYFQWLAEVECLVALALGVNSVTYLDRRSVNQALNRTDNQLCRHCFGGTHPVTGQKRPAYHTQFERTKSEL